MYSTGLKQKLGSNRHYTVLKFMCGCQLCLWPVTHDDGQRKWMFFCPLFTLPLCSTCAGNPFWGGCQGYWLLQCWSRGQLCPHALLFKDWSLSIVPGSRPCFICPSFVRQVLKNPSVPFQEGKSVDVAMLAARGVKPYGPPVDVWAAGVLAYELVCGR